MAVADLSERAGGQGVRWRPVSTEAADYRGLALDSQRVSAFRRTCERHNTIEWNCFDAVAKTRI